jgi:flavodoxin
VNAIVVYESLWGNTGAIARAIAEGIGPDAVALTTDEATPELVSGCDLIVAGAPVHAFRLASEASRQKLARDTSEAELPPDLAHPALRTWLDALPPGRGRHAAFDTRLWWSPGSATGTITKLLERAGYAPLTKAQKFIVKGTHGPLRDGEVERARQWGEELALMLASEVRARAA